MDSPCIKQTVCKVLNIFQHGKYLVEYVLKADTTPHSLVYGLDFLSQNTPIVRKDESCLKILANLICFQYPPVDTSKKV